MQQCPACGSGAPRQSTPIPDEHYRFGAAHIAIPEPGISLVECGACGLRYKSRFPERSFLGELFRSNASAKWCSDYDSSRDVDLLRRLWGRPAFDLLDIGAAGGALLVACTTAGIVGRRSALDVMRYPGIERGLRGEFIEGSLDGSALRWSGKRYDIVTLFDVLEHLYEPRVAFERLRALVRRRGLVFIETGDAESFWPARFGIHQWWYTRLIEHHVFWCRDALERIAGEHGFEIVYWRQVRHNSRRRLQLAKAFSDILKAGVYCLSPQHYAAFARLLGGQGNQPWFPFARDHLRVALMKL